MHVQLTRCAYVVNSSLYSLANHKVENMENARFLNAENLIQKTTIEKNKQVNQTPASDDTK